jgi:hypothetical protein
VREGSEENPRSRQRRILCQRRAHRVLTWGVMMLRPMVSSMATPTDWYHPTLKSE